MCGTSANNTMQTDLFGIIILPVLVLFFRKIWIGPAREISVLTSSRAQGLQVVIVSLPVFKTEW